MPSYFLATLPNLGISASLQFHIVGPSFAQNTEHIGTKISPVYEQSTKGNLILFTDVKLLMKYKCANKSGCHNQYR